MDHAVRVDIIEALRDVDQLMETKAKNPEGTRKGSRGELDLGQGSM